MPETPYRKIFEIIRGDVVESIHSGALAVVDVSGNLIASFGDPFAVTYLRSSAKPFQLLPFIEHGGQFFYNLTPREIAVMAASHSGTNEHTALVQNIQVKTGVSEAELLCGVHAPYHEPTAESMRQKNEAPTPNRNNCSGKHTGMLAFVHMQDLTGENLPYIDPAHPVQEEIRKTFAEMCSLDPNQVAVGIDGCSAPNFAVPLYNTALAYARLCDPENGGVESPERAAACRVITSAMMFNPDMVAGPGRFDTILMEAGMGNLLSKGGAEGFQGIGVMPGALHPGSPAFGIAIKIADGDARKKIIAAVSVEVLRQLGALTPEQSGTLSNFGPKFPVLNLRKIHAGEGRPVFNLEKKT